MCKGACNDLAFKVKVLHVYFILLSNIHVLDSLQVVEDISLEVLSFSASSKTPKLMKTYCLIGKEMW